MRKFMALFLCALLASTPIVACAEEVQTEVTVNQEVTEESEEITEEVDEATKEVVEESVAEEATVEQELDETIEETVEEIVQVEETVEEVIEVEEAIETEETIEVEETAEIEETVEEVVEEVAVEAETEELVEEEVVETIEAAAPVESRTVEYWKENANNDEYALSETVENGEEKSFKGFHVSNVVEEDGVTKIYYERDRYTVVFKKTNGEQVTDPIVTKIGANMYEAWYLTNPTIASYTDDLNWSWWAMWKGQYWETNFVPDNQPAFDGNYNGAVNGDTVELQLRKYAQDIYTYRIFYEESEDIEGRTACDTFEVDIEGETYKFNSYTESNVGYTPGHKQEVTLYAPKNGWVTSHVDNYAASAPGRQPDEGTNIKYTFIKKAEGGFEPLNIYKLRVKEQRMEDLDNTTTESADEETDDTTEEIGAEGFVEGAQDGTNDSDDSEVSGAQDDPNVQSDPETQDDPAVEEVVNEEIPDHQHEEEVLEDEKDEVSEEVDDEQGSDIHEQVEEQANDQTVEEVVAADTDDYDEVISESEIDEQLPTSPIYEWVVEIPAIGPVAVSDETLDIGEGDIAETAEVNVVPAITGTEKPEEVEVVRNTLNDDVLGTLRSTDDVLGFRRNINTGDESNAYAYLLVLMACVVSICHMVRKTR